MTANGRLSQYGAQALANHISGNAPVYIGSSAPTWVPGLSWVNTTSGAVRYEWNSSAWVLASTMGQYIALLTADPTTGPAINVSDLTEVTTAGYSRSAVTFTAASSAYPAVVSNNGTLTWGPLSADMLLAAEWAALVTCASGTLGIFKYSWPIAPQQKATSQVMQLATGGLTLSES